MISEVVVDSLVLILLIDFLFDYFYLRAKPTKSLLRTYTRYKTLHNELANDGVNLSKHEINVGFMNSLLEKWLTFSQGLRNVNHTQTLDLADIYGSTAISTAFFSNNVIHDFQENSDDEIDERSSEEYLRDLDIEFHERALLANSKRLVAETFDWDEEEVSDDEEVTRVKVLMALANDELTVGKNHVRNGKWIDITMRKKVLGGELFTESSSKMSENENLFVPASMGILVPESQVVNESLKPTETSNTPEPSKDSEAESLAPLPPLKNLQGASPSSKVMPLTFQPYSPKDRPGLGIMKHTKPETQDSFNKSISGPITISETEPTTPLVPTEVKDTEQ
ncbi:hypothetical protein Tco_1272206 [Tanacetum coccineum]